MKYIKFIFIAIGLAVGFYEYSKPKANQFILLGALVLFMYGMMRLSASVESKNQEDENETS
jgi:hypothetical protein